jgi:hypothetical protein
MRSTWVCLALAAGSLLCTTAASGAETAGPVSAYIRKDSWTETLLASRTALAKLNLPEKEQRIAATALWARFERDFPVQWDWLMQDYGRAFSDWLGTPAGASIERGLIARVLDELAEPEKGLRSDYALLRRQQPDPGDSPWLEFYGRACELRRIQRLRRVVAETPRIVFTRHRTIRPSFFAYTEGQSDAQNEAHFLPGAALCLLEMGGPHGQVRTLFEDPNGAIRDPAVSWDGRRVVFAWKKSFKGDDYHLHEIEVESGRVRQITFGLGFADYEPSYLPNGDLIFASTRCVQTVDCWWTEVSNLYTCDPNGRGLRRLSFDQVHAIYPTVTDDGRVLYTRWDYNDRGQIFPQPLFQMNPDGTGQTEFYGNNSWFPTTIAHARGIPGTPKALAVLCGHHTSQAGKLAIIDPARGRQENSGVQLVAPVRPTRADRIDGYGQEGELFQYPWPLSETEFLVTYAPLGWEGQAPEPTRRNDAHFGIYWMDVNGRRELLASDPALACQQPVLLAARPAPPTRPSTVDHRKQTGTYYVQDVYAGPGLRGVARGTVKKLRVVALDFRPAGVGNNGSAGPGGGALISTPIAVGHGSWDVKIVLGEAAVHEDGSAFFSVPARTPVYFQAIDGRGHAVQTMRSWSTLQPGEAQSCVGCHEHKNTAPPIAGYAFTLALRAGVQSLTPFYGPPRGFSFPKEIQPILDRHCTRCHNERNTRMKRDTLPGLKLRERDPVWDPAVRSAGFSLSGKPAGFDSKTNSQPAFSLLDAETVDRLAKRRWSDSYLNLTQAHPAGNEWDRGSFAGTCDGRVVNWIGSQSIPAPLPPRMAGACRSGLITLLEEGHYQVRLSREDMDKIACWIDLYVPYCGDYTEANAWTPSEMQFYQRYLDKRQRMEQEERANIAGLLADRLPHPRN